MILTYLDGEIHVSFSITRIPPPLSPIFNWEVIYPENRNPVNVQKWMKYLPSL
jgi:hypothetical protein